jgi:hypothetical protein
MKYKIIALSMFVASCCENIIANAADTTGAPQIAYSTKFGGVDFLFTEAVETQAQADGSNFQTAIRAVGFEIISAVGNAAKSSPDIQAVLIDRIKFKENKALVVLGIIVDGKFQRLNFNGKASDLSAQKFLDYLDQKRATVLRTDGQLGVEIFLASN